MKGEGVDFYCWHCLHNCLGGQFCGTLLPLYSVFGHFTGPPEWPPINQLRQWWFPALKSQLNSYETPLFKEQTLRKGEEKEENRYKGRQSLGRSVKKDYKGRHQLKKNVFFRALPELPNPPPPMTPIRATWSSFFGSRNSRFESQFRTKNTIYTI